MRHSLPDSRTRLAPRVTLLIALVAAVAALPVAGCSSDSSEPEEPAAITGSEKTPERTVTLASDGRVFNPAKIYSETVGGVISVSSIFGSQDIGPFDSRAAGGSGFVLNDDGEVVTNAHVITNGEGENRKVADRVFVEFKDGNIIPA